MLLASAIFVPLCAQAAGDASVRGRHPPGVIMMIGGLTNSDDAAGESIATFPARVATVSAPPGRLSVVTQPGAPQSSPATALSVSVASRVMQLAPIVDEVARAAGMDSALLMAVIDVESGGNSQAVSAKGATGLMQLMPDTGSRQGASDLFDPRQNIAAGAHYLRQLIQQFGDVRLALAAYNAGEGAVQKYGGQIPPYAETMNYVPKVMGRYAHYRNAVSPTSGAVFEAGMDALQDRFLRVRQTGAPTD